MKAVGIVVLLFGLLACATAVNAACQWYFTSDAEGWTSVNQITGWGWENGGVRGTTSGGDPFVRGPDCSCSGSTYRYIKIGLLWNDDPVTYTAQFFFNRSGENWSGERVVSFTTSYNNGQVMTYWVDMLANPYWYGSTITKLRFDPNMTSGKKFWIAEIELMQDVWAPTVWSVGVTSGLTVDVTFDDVMGSGVTTASNYTVSGTGKGTLASNPSSVSLVSGNTYRCAWSSGEMKNGGDITITVSSNVKDKYGNGVGSPNSKTHTGGGIGTAPTVSTVAVQTGLTVDVTFSEAMGATATDASNYTVSGTGKGTLASNPDSVALVSGNKYRLTWNSGEMKNGGDITITVSSAVQDLAGNGVGSPNSKTHTGGGIGTMPSVTINQASGQADPTSASPINFTAVFSESVTGFTDEDVTIGGTAGATTAVVTGGPTEYNVAISGMTQSGTVTASIAAGVAHDAAGNGNTASTSTDNEVTYSASVSIVEAKQKADGESVTLQGKEVTAIFDDHFYIEETSGPQGLRVKPTEMPSGLAVGDTVDLTGTIRTNDEDERYVDASSVTRTPGTPSIDPLGMNTKAVGGGNWYYNESNGAGQKGVENNEGNLNNIGLLVKVTGEVTAVGSDFFYLRDGYEARDYSIFRGIRVRCPGLSKPSSGSTKAVTGISQIMKAANGKCYRSLRPRSYDDIATPS